MMHVLTSVACIAFLAYYLNLSLALMILLDCDRNSTNNYIFRSPVQQIVRNQSISRTTVFYKPLFELSVMRGNFFRWAGFGDIPSSHGDIPVVSFLMYEVESTKHIFLGFLDFSTLWKLFQCLLQVSKMQVFACTFYMIGFSFDANTQFLLSFVDAVELVSIFKFSFPFSAILCGCRLQLFQPILFQIISNWFAIWLWKTHVNFV